METIIIVTAMSMFFLIIAKGIDRIEKKIDKIMEDREIAIDN